MVMKILNNKSITERKENIAMNITCCYHFDCKGKRHYSRETKLFVIKGAVQDTR